RNAVHAAECAGDALSPPGHRCDHDTHRFRGPAPAAPRRLHADQGTAVIFAIKAEVSDLSAETLAFSEQKTMYGGKHIAKGDSIFVFASENEGGPGLIASGVVTSARAIPKKRGIARQTPRVSITVTRTALAKRRLGRSELKPF